MKVAVLGGTGVMGGAIAKRLSKKHGIIIGSRDPAKAREAARRIQGAKGTDYAGAARECEVALAAVPYSGIGAMAALAEELAGKLVISIINPIKLEGGFLRYGLEEGSAAEKLAAILPRSRVATAFNNVPVAMIKEEGAVAIDILVAASSWEAYEEAAEIVRSVPNLRPLYAGPLSEAQLVERITPLVLNLAKWNETGTLTTKFVSRKG